MVEIRPFQGYYCNAEKNSVEDFFTLPYDKISPELADKLYKKNFNNVHLVLGQQFPSDTNTNNRYTRSRDTLDKWIKDELLVKSTRPCLYLYKQIFRYKGDVCFERRGIISLLKLEDLDSGHVRPHEFTLSKAKTDRLSLLKETKANLGQIFMLYEDKAKHIEKILTNYEKTNPLLDASDEQGERHTIWEIDHARDIEEIQKFFLDKNLLIADGHHRYETSLMYRNEERASHKLNGQDCASDFIMVTLVNMFEKDMLVLPTHRLIRNVEMSFQDMLSQVSNDFQLFDTLKRDKSDFEVQAMSFLKGEKDGESRIVCVGHDAPEAACVILQKNKNPVTLISKKYSNAWKKLDVSILHELILEKVLGIGEEKLREGNHVSYVREISDALEKLQKNENRFLFLLNPTRVEQVSEVAQEGDRMPQKSTDFYPKMYSGLVLRKFED